MFKPCQAQCPMFFWGPMFLEPNSSGALFLEAQCFWSLCRPKPMWSLGRPNVSRALSQCLGPMLLELGLFWNLARPHLSGCLKFLDLPWSGPVSGAFAGPMCFCSLARPHVSAACQAQCFWSLVRPCLFWSRGLHRLEPCQGH